MMRKRVPRNLWEYVVRWEIKVIQRTSTQAGGLQKACPLQDATGETLAIYECLYFSFYDHLSYKENPVIGMRSIKRWLGVSQRVGVLMSY